MDAANLFKVRQKATTRVCIIVPVKDEEEHLPDTLNALYHQTGLGGLPLDKNLYEVLLLTNNCTDNSHQLALSYQKQHPDFNLHVADIKLAKDIAHIGTVRRLLMDEAYSRFMRYNHSQGIIASTDGDSEVDNGWVYHIILAMDKGIDVVGGRIIAKNTPALSRLNHLQNVAYRYYVSKLEASINPCAHDPWPRHFQCYGPSVAVTCQTYSRAGRLPILPYLEDEEFRKSLYRIDAKVRMCPNVKVYTSSRTAGKVDFGFSVQLQKWAEMHIAGKQVEVETLSALAEKFELKRLLKDCWLEPSLFRQRYDKLAMIAERLKINQTWLELEFVGSKYFGALWEKVEQKIAEDGNWQKFYLSAPIGEVIAELRNFFYGEQQVTHSIPLIKFRDIA